MTETTPPHADLLHQVKDIVAAFVANNTVGVVELPNIIISTHAALRGLSAPRTQEPSLGPLTPAVPIKKSVTDDKIICLECAKAFVSIRRHLANAHHTTPDQYRKKWGLLESYPMVAVGYSHRRSELAKKSGLGRKARR